MDRVRPLQACRPVSLMSSARRLSRSSGHAEYPSRCARMPGIASASASFELDAAVEVLEPPIAPELLAAGARSTPRGDVLDRKQLARSRRLSLLISIDAQAAGGKRRSELVSRVEQGLVQGAAGRVSRSAGTAIGKPLSGRSGQACPRRTPTPDLDQLVSCLNRLRTRRDQRAIRQRRCRRPHPGRCGAHTRAQHSRPEPPRGWHTRRGR